MWQYWWCVLSLAIRAQAGHFDGGSIRWTPLNASATTSPFQIAISQSYSYTLSTLTCTVGALLGSTGIGFNYSLWCTLNCGNTSAGYIPPPVLGYCTGSNTALNIAFSQRTDVVNVTIGDYFSVSFGILNTLTSGYYRPLTLSTGNITTTAHWNITTAIDVRVRADTGRINTPPVANLMSPRGIPLNIPTLIVIPTLDIDNDDVRCRWGNSSLECGNVCFPATVSPSTSLSTNCILNITGTSLTATYAGSIQAEDFSTTSSTTALSSIPVQFLIYVYAPKNCSIPTLTSSTSCMDVQVGLSYTSTLTATNNCGSPSNISDIVVQSFAGVVEGSLVPVNQPYVYTRDITFTPLNTQLGPQILCAIALDNTNVPSDQYCITFIVATVLGSTCSIFANTTAQSISATQQTSTTNSNSINWAFVGTGAGLTALFALLVGLCCCYYFVWSGKARFRRQQRQQARKQFEYKASDNQSNCSTVPFSVPPKSYHVYDLESERSPTSTSANDNKSAVYLPLNEISVQRIEPIPSHRFSISDEPGLATEIQGTTGSVVVPQVSNSDTAESAMDEKNESRIETKKKRKIKKRKLVIVKPVFDTKEHKMPKNEQGSKPSASTVHVARIVT